MTPAASKWSLWRGLCVAAVMASGVLAEDILQTVGFRDCGNNTDITVDKVDIAFNADTKVISFDIIGSSAREQNVSALLRVTAYGNDIFSNDFEPCDPETFVEQLCPVPAGRFSAKGEQEIPTQFADLVPKIAFQVPDIAALAKLELRSKDDDSREVACISSQVSNGKTANVPAVPYVAAGVAGAALVASGVSAASALVAGGGFSGIGAAGAAGGGGTGGAGSISPSFTEVMGWFQGLAMNGMLSVNYPPVYRTFTRNFAFSTGIVSWEPLQRGIDAFRAKTGGDVSKDSVEALKNATLVFPDGSTVTHEKRLDHKVRRAVEAFQHLARRQIEVNTGDTTTEADPAGTDAPQLELSVSGIQAFTAELMVPKSNTFMTVLLCVAILIAAIAVSILLVKVILEAWALFGSFPKSLAGFRKHYWGSIARTITTLILLLYGIWVLYCVFQFTQGDSWAAKTLAGVTLFIFTAVLLFFCFKIWNTARRLRHEEGDASGLYENKDIWVKYSLFYESYRQNYWWVFVPTIVYMFVKGCALAAGDGHGLPQTIAQLLVEAVMLIMLLWSRPYERKSGNVINIIIQVVRVLSVICILVFVEEFGIRQTTQTVTGVVLIAVQSALTGILVILIAWNAINACCKTNPHRRRRKEMEKRNRDTDCLTPLDARNSLMLDRQLSEKKNSMFSVTNTGHEKAEDSLPAGVAPEQYAGAEEATLGIPGHQRLGSGGLQPYRPLTPIGANDASQSLMGNAAPPGIARQPVPPSSGGYPGYSSGPAPPYGGAYRYPPNNGSYNY